MNRKILYIEVSREMLDMHTTFEIPGRLIKHIENIQGVEKLIHAKGNKYSYNLSVGFIFNNQGIIKQVNEILGEGKGIEFNYEKLETEEVKRVMLDVDESNVFVFDSPQKEKARDIMIEFLGAETLEGIDDREFTSENVFMMIVKALGE